MLLTTDNSINYTLAPTILMVSAKYILWKREFAMQDTSMDAFYNFVSQPSIERTIFLNNFNKKIEILSPTITRVVYL